MSNLKEIESAVSKLSTDELATFREWFAKFDAEQQQFEEDAKATWERSQSTKNQWSGIEKTPGVCGGDARIANTRIPVWVLVQARRLGSSEIDLLQNYPTLSANHLANAWAYAASHTEELDRAICENNEA